MTMTGGEGRRPRFRKVTAPLVGAVDPESLFGELPRTPKGVGALWSHQADQLRVYARDHRDTPDVALELPTGSGKTLVGLLLSEWRRRALGQRVVYACPTKQLARQVLEKAALQGIPAVLLIGSNRAWNQADLARYTRGDAVAITTYSSVFNFNSHLSDAQTLVFDDAHAAEGYVAEAWAISVEGSTGIYEQLFDSLSDAVDPAFVGRMMAPDGPAADSGEVRLIPVSAVAERLAELDAVLGTLTDDSAWRFRMVRANLSSCLFYVAREGFYIRPMIPPTFQHSPFTAPTQRIYLSATLGDAGELERSFGRTGIARVPVPPAWDRAGSGRRFFVFPQLSPNQPEEAAEDGGTPGGQIGDLLALGDKRLILTPDDTSAVKMADRLEIPTGERFTAKDPETGIAPFVDAAWGTLLAANRYDGMDLADDACRLMLMSGLPTASHLQDRFLQSKLRAGEVLNERIRTRVLQGAGRCTRGPRDWAVVIVDGEDILRFLSRTEVRESLPVELQAEILFGLEQSQAPADDLLLLAESALEQDDVWQEDAEPELARLRREAVRTQQPVVAELAESATREVRAWSLAWNQDWEGAARAAVEVLDHLTSPGLRPYRALWAYLGSAWSGLAADGGDNAAAERSVKLLQTAHGAAVGTTWLKEVAPLQSEAVDSEPVDAEAVERIMGLLRGTYSSGSKLRRDASQMLANLNQQAATDYEVGLVALGTLLGAQSFKPPGKGRADAAWIWEPWWITVEAKSEQEASGMLSMDYVRQANTQLSLLAADRGAEASPEGSLSVIASPRGVVDPDAVPIANPNVYLTSPTGVLDIAHDADRAWKDLRGVSVGVGDDALRPELARILWQHRVLPTQVRERLSKDPIRGS